MAPLGYVSHALTNAVTEDGESAYALMGRVADSRGVLPAVTEAALPGSATSLLPESYTGSARTSWARPDQSPRTPDDAHGSIAPKWSGLDCWSLVTTSVLSPAARRARSGLIVLEAGCGHGRRCR